MLILVGGTTPLQAQMVPQSLGLDSSLRLEYLFGNQLLRSVDRANDPVDQFRIEYNPRLPVLALAAELSPLPLFSGRFAGALSVLESNTSTNRPLSSTSAPSDWSVHPDYGSWELAGLFHLSSGGGYRFSVTAGYRTSEWQYTADSGRGSGYGVKDKFSSYIPFMGLQTAMFFPWWKARFEMIGSPFMTRRSTVSMWQNGTFLEQRVEADKGGLIELIAEGTVGVRPGIWAGLLMRYHYEELYGHSSGGTTQRAALNNAKEFYSQESFVSLGLNLSIVY